MMADLAVEVAVTAGLPRGLERSMSARGKPAPNAPICRKLRRERPSQNRCFEPRMLNIRIPPLRNWFYYIEPILLCRQFGRNTNFLFELGRAARVWRFRQRGLDGFRKIN